MGQLPGGLQMEMGRTGLGTEPRSPQRWKDIIVFPMLSSTGTHRPDHKLSSHPHYISPLCLT